MMGTIPLLVLSFSLASTVLAQTETPQAFCIRTAGAGYTPKFDSTGNFNGECEIASVNICLGTEYANPKTGATLCCDDPNIVVKDAGKEGCCPPGQLFKWNAASSTGICATPPPPQPPIPPTPAPPAVSCPSSAGQYITRNGIRFQIFCERAVREMIPAWALPAAMAQLAKSGSETYDSCLNQCANDPKCHGVNFFTAKHTCGINNKGPGSPFRVGSLYELPPPPGSNVISFVSVPRRA